MGVERVKSVSLTVRKGEIVGIAGVSGNGQSELLEALAGIRAPAGGTIAVNGEPLFPNRHFGVELVRHHKIAHVPEDRHKMGLINAFACRESAILGYQDEPTFRRWHLMDWAAVTRDTLAKMTSFDVRPRNPMLKAANMSGGNQQKLVLAREIEHDPDVLLVGQPTRGVDIGAIEFIHKRLLAMREAGKAILLISAELDEIMSLSDRILVMFDGRVLGEVEAAKADERTLGLLMAGCADEAAQPAGGAA
jgi:general nucleoside transport system ATP-binding protein